MAVVGADVVVTGFGTAVAVVMVGVVVRGIISDVVPSGCRLRLVEVIAHLFAVTSPVLQVRLHEFFCYPAVRKALEIRLTFLGLRSINVNRTKNW